MRNVDIGQPKCEDLGVDARLRTQSRRGLPPGPRDRVTEWEAVGKRLQRAIERDRPHGAIPRWRRNRPYISSIS